MEIGVIGVIMVHAQRHVVQECKLEVVIAPTLHPPMADHPVTVHPQQLQLALPEHAQVQLFSNFVLFLY